MIVIRYDAKLAVATVTMEPEDAAELMRSVATLPGATVTDAINRAAARLAAAASQLQPLTRREAPEDRP